MVEDYKVKRFASINGGNITINASYSVNSELEFLAIAIAKDKKIIRPLNLNWAFVDDVWTALVANPFTDNCAFDVYLFRVSEINNVLELDRNGDLTTDSICKQFEKILENEKELQKNFDNSLRFPDEDDLLDKNSFLPNAENRTNKILSFDEKGNPVCVQDLEEIIGAYKARDEAEEYARQCKSDKQACETARMSAQGFANSARLSEEKASQAEQEVSRNKTAIDGILESITSMWADVKKWWTESKTFRDEASTSATNALTCATNSSNSATAANLSASSAKTSADNAKASADKALDATDGLNFVVINKKLCVKHETTGKAHALRYGVVFGVDTLYANSNPEN